MDISVLNPKEQFLFDQKRKIDYVIVLKEEVFDAKDILELSTHEPMKPLGSIGCSHAGNTG